MRDTEKGSCSEQHPNQRANALHHFASIGRGYVTDSLLLLAWSSLTFWNAWFLGRSLLARSPRFRSPSSEPDETIVAALALRFITLFALDILIYARFAWSPPREGCEERTAHCFSEVDRLRVALAELRRENEALRLQVALVV